MLQWNKFPKPENLSKTIKRLPYLDFFKESLYLVELNSLINLN